ncbi:hypothetical protein HQ590_04060 [bacterium]|nr:hypothetical protein [bacterium]
MSTKLWSMLAVAGFGLMLVSYFGFQRIDRTAPGAGALVLLGDSAPGPQAESFRPLTVRLRLLPGSAVSRSIVAAIVKSAGKGKSIETQIRPKLFLLDPGAVGIGPRQLRRGRLPEPGADEVLAGCQAPWSDQIVAAGRRFKVVGVFRPDVAVLASSYLLPPDDAVSGLFADGDPDVRRGALILLSPAQWTDVPTRKQLAAAYPRDRFARVAPMHRSARGPYYLYLGGMALMLLGGSGTFIGLYRRLASVLSWAPLRRPLNALAARSRLLWGVHLAYFGTAILAALIIYELPDAQTIMLTITRDAVSGDAGASTSVATGVTGASITCGAVSGDDVGREALAIAVKAYRSGSIAKAAVVTFAINLLLGSIAFITLPSLIIPGIGALAASARAAMWGVLLAPTFVRLSATMLPHSWTLLIEGEAYILAAFFALLIPITLLKPDPGATVLRRFGSVALLNLQANLLVAIVLAVAACYEATEVILIVRFGVS